VYLRHGLILISWTDRLPCLRPSRGRCHQRWPGLAGRLLFGLVGDEPLVMRPFASALV